MNCDECGHNVPKERREPFGDVVERWCDKCQCWLDCWYEGVDGETFAPCERSGA